MSLAARHAVRKNMDGMLTAMERLSTGKRINSAKDDPAGFIASSLLRSDIVATKADLKMNQREGAKLNMLDRSLAQVETLLNDIRGSIIEGANTGALSSGELDALQTQIDETINSIYRIAGQAEFNGQKLLEDLHEILNPSKTATTGKPEEVQEEGGSVCAEKESNADGEIVADVTPFLASIQQQGTGKEKSAGGNSVMDLIQEVLQAAAARFGISAELARDALLQTMPVSNRTNEEEPQETAEATEEKVDETKEQGSGEKTLETEETEEGENREEELTLPASSSVPEELHEAQERMDTEPVPGENREKESTNGSTFGDDVHVATVNGIDREEGAARHAAKVGTEGFEGIEFDEEKKIMRRAAVSGEVVHVFLDTPKVELIQRDRFVVEAAATARSARRASLAEVSSQLQAELLSTAMPDLTMFSPLALTSLAAVENRQNGDDGSKTGEDTISLNDSAADSASQATQTSACGSSTTNTTGCSENPEETINYPNLKEAPKEGKESEKKHGWQPSLIGGLEELRSGGDASLHNNPEKAEKIVQGILDSVFIMRAKVGADLKYRIDVDHAMMTDQLYHMSALEAEISDADFATEASNYAKYQLLLQSSIAVLQMIDELPRMVLKLLEQ